MLPPQGRTLTDTIRAENARYRGICATLATLTGWTWHPEPQSGNVCAYLTPTPTRELCVSPPDGEPGVWTVGAYDRAGEPIAHESVTTTAADPEALAECLPAILRLAAG